MTNDDGSHLNEQQRAYVRLFKLRTNTAETRRKRKLLLAKLTNAQRMAAVAWIIRQRVRDKGL